MRRCPERVESVRIEPGVVVIVEIVDARVPIFLDGHGFVGRFGCVFLGFDGDLPGNHDHGVASHACEHDEADHAGEQRGFHGFHVQFLSKTVKRTNSSILFYSFNTIGFHVISEFNG
jgi:hypothetical protein